MSQKNDEWREGAKPCGRLYNFLEAIFNLINGAKNTRAFVLLLDTEKNVNADPLRGLTEVIGDRQAPYQTTQFPVNPAGPVCLHSV